MIMNIYRDLPFDVLVTTQEFAVIRDWFKFLLIVFPAQIVIFCSVLGIDVLGVNAR